jgi:nitric oxide dioxygenase
MTPEQIAMVDEIVGRVCASEAFAVRFYEALFAAAPATREMFPDLAAQRAKLRVELETLVRLLRDFGALEAEAALLGRRHREYGVRAAHYRVARGAMELAVEAEMGAELTDRHRAAWRQAYDLITELMQA